MNLKIKFFIITLAALLSGQASAAGYRSFTASCNATSAEIFSNVKITSIFSDVTEKNSGFYITSGNNKIWRIDQAVDFPENYQTDEMRSLVKTALLSGMKVNICGTKSTNPITVWIIELVA